MTFESGADLARWLARQSDLTLSGVVGEPPLRDWRYMGNQRLDRGRLLAYIN
ncbi:hypothetical protein [Gymnodinialimonas ceratoperidinii]|uniref:Uncharacterized protein n=1 Tax=Gymnodinialimonas ceratoperidinii TaxID=2856823 RepID=A0A8F6TUF1_9RHOB|nr:hypothetical protein [Gymnodinialimonas ceratoperidinii]QXT39162.1 hypothetical protein KYE46_14710 [Gymnodinialimonas ceratoperidinii]